MLCSHYLIRLRDVKIDLKINSFKTQNISQSIFDLGRRNKIFQRFKAGKLKETDNDLEATMYEYN